MKRQPLDVPMESRMRWKSQVRFGGLPDTSWSKSTKLFASAWRRDRDRASMAHPLRH